MFADPGQLRQVIDVLCDNAVHHFGGEAHRLNMRLVGGITHESGGPFLELRDNGPGIPKDAQANLFEPFFTTRNEGTGLGLYIARQLCEANHIRLEYLSQPTGGSCFRLSFPNPQTVPKTMTQPLALIVDDEPDIRELLEITLARMDIDCRTAGTRGRGHAATGQRPVRPLPGRHAPARRQRHRSRAPCQQRTCRDADRGDHRARQHGDRGRGAQGRCVRFRLQAGRPAGAATPGRNGAAPGQGAEPSDRLRAMASCSANRRRCRTSAA